MLYPEVLWAGRFFNECSEEKNRIAAGESGGGGAVNSCQCGPVAKPPPNFGYLAFCGAQNIIFVAVCDNKQ